MYRAVKRFQYLTCRFLILAQRLALFSELGFRTDDPHAVTGIRFVPKAEVREAYFYLKLRRERR